MAAINTFLRCFRCREPSSSSCDNEAFLSDARLGPPIPPLAGGASDRSNRFFWGRSGHHGSNQRGCFPSASLLPRTRTTTGGETRAEAESTTDLPASPRVAVGGAVAAQATHSPTKPTFGVSTKAQDGIVDREREPDVGIILRSSSGVGIECGGSNSAVTDSAINERAGSARGTSFVDRLISLADSPGQLRVEALGLLTRIGRSYPAHLSGGSGGRGDDNGGGSGDISDIVGKGDGDGRWKQARERWERAAGLLLRCFADPDQNLRLHALKVVEALLLARAEKGATVTGTPNPTATATATATAAASAPLAISMSMGAVSGPSMVCATAGGTVAVETKTVSSLVLNPLVANDMGDEGGNKEEVTLGATSGEGSEKVSMTERRIYVEGIATGDGVGSGGGNGGGLWRDLVQKHLQRALEDPYHGVRAVACSCHGCLLDSDWEAFPKGERDRCLDRLLAATRDRAAGKLNTN